MMNLKAALLIGAVALSAAAGSAQATPITFAFTATVNAPGLGRATGAPIGGSFTFESTVAGSVGLDGTRYAGAVTDFVLDGHRLAAPLSQADVLIDTFAANGIADLFRVTQSSTAGTLDFTLSTDRTTNQLPAAGLPTTPPSLAAFQAPGAFSLLDVQFATTGPGFAVLDATPTSLVHQVPEPASLAVLAMGIGGLWLVGRNSRKA